MCQDLGENLCYFLWLGTKEFKKKIVFVTSILNNALNITRYAHARNRKRQDGWFLPDLPHYELKLFSLSCCMRKYWTWVFENAQWQQI